MTHPAQVELYAHDSRHTSNKRLPQLGLGAALEPVTAFGLGVVDDKTNPPSYMPTTPIGAAAGAGAVWALGGALIALVTGVDPAEAIGPNTATFGFTAGTMRAQPDTKKT